MDGHEYEHACAQYLKRTGFTNVQVTKASGDQGIDVIATKGKKYGIQCKYYTGNVGNKAVQEAYAGAKFYGCDVAVVMTNSTFTKSAKELAEKLGVELWEKKEETVLKNQRLTDSHKTKTIADRVAFVLTFPCIFFALMCLLSSLWSRKLDVELLAITLVIFIADVWLLSWNYWKNRCKRNKELLESMGIAESQWNRKEISVGELDMMLDRIDEKRSTLTDGQLKKCHTIEISIFNLRNGIVDRYYNKHPELPVNEADYRMPRV